MLKIPRYFRAKSWILTAIFALSVSVVGLSASAGASPAQQSITLSPASTPISEAPGSTYSGSLTVLNNSDTPATVSVYTQPYYVKGVEYTPSFTQLPGTTNASQWVNLSKATLQIPATQSTSVPYTLTIPANTAPGGYYAVIFVQTQQQKANAGVQASDRIGNILYITAQGQTHTGGSVISTSLPHFSMASSLPLSMEVSNTGGVHYVTTANITSKNIYGQSVFSASLQRYVLPQTIRKISTDWKTPAFGIFHISREATVAGQSESLPTQWIIVVHPWVLIVFVLLVLLLVAAIVFPKYKKRKAR